MFNHHDVSRDAFMLHGPLAHHGYDWWWHSLTAQDAETGEDKPFVIEDKSSEWSDFVGEGEYELVQTYVYRSVRRVFDPPTNSSHLNALKEDMKEDEWRLNVQAELED